MSKQSTFETSVMTIFDEITRRRLLAATAAIASAPLATGLPADLAFAKAAMINKPAPGFYRFKVGAFELSVISDGPLSLGPPTGELFKGISMEELKNIQEANFRPTDKIEIDQVVLVVNTGKNLVLFDTGLGTVVKDFGPNAGRLLTNLKAAGINPNEIDTLALTHAHPDHCFAILNERGKRNFPKAQIYITQADYDFWTDEKNSSGEKFKHLFIGARRQLVPNRDRIAFVKDGQEIVPGVQAIATPGHTVGHSSYMITSQNQSLLNLGDVAHHFALSVERPEVEFVYDTDGKQAVASRRRIFDMLAKDRIPMVAYHFPWPGIGYLTKQGDGYRYHPAWARTVL